MAQAYIALGSNLGDRASLLQGALAKISQLPTTHVKAVSSFQETAPVDAPVGSPSFLNAAVAIETELSPVELLAHLLEIERGLGRTRGRDRNASRSIDLDLLLHGTQVIDTPELVLPHPRMEIRRFVLEPLAQIAPDAYHPVAGKTVRELLDVLPPAADCVKV